MFSLNPTDYISLCDLLPSEVSFLCTDVAGVPLWAIVALFAVGVLLVLALKLIVIYIKVMTPL